MAQRLGIVNATAELSKSSGPGLFVLEVQHLAAAITAKNTLNMAGEAIVRPEKTILRTLLMSP